MKTLISLLVAAAMATTVWAAPVRVETKQEIGPYLVDENGMTLYRFTKDATDKSVCAGDCVSKWPLYFNKDVAGAEGVSAADFGTITRSDGAMQTTYRGMPLYYFFKDKAAGDTAGQGVNNVWYVVKP